MSNTSIRRALAQNLRTDSLLGVRSVPIPSGRRGRKDKDKRLKVLDEGQVQSCTKCGLAKTRTKTVFGQGNGAARLVFVGEAPGADEDRSGLAFVGRAGKLLTDMIVAMGLTREEVFICNLLKCRPPNNRDPAPDETKSCSPYLMEQLSIIEPEVIVTLGAPATRLLLNTDETIGRLRGRFHDFYLSDQPGEGTAIPLMPTYHPAYLMRKESEKSKTWADLKMVLAQLGLPVPAR